MKQHMLYKAVLRAALLSSTMSFAFSAAQAQETQTPASAEKETSADKPDLAGMADILVTARRVQESSQRVPIAISAVTADMLGKQQIYDARSLMIQIPGLQQATRIPGNAVPTTLTRIRGVSGIANYFNDVPWPGAQWSFYAPFFDVQGIEVLKGPQGTLFGQASNAGAIISRPTRPGEEFGGYIRGQVGNYNERAIEGAMDIPLVKDRVFLRLAGKTDYRQGYARDIFSGARNGKMDYDIERATLVVKATDTLENETMFQMEHIRELGQTVWIPNDYDFLAQNSTSAQKLALSAQAIRNGFEMPAGTVNAFTQTSGAFRGRTGDITAWNAARDLILAQQGQIGPYRIQGWSVGCPATALSPATPSTVPAPNVNHTNQQSCAFGTGGYAKNYAIVNKTTWEFAPDFALKNIFSHTWGGNNVQSQDLDGTHLIMQDSDNAGAGLWQHYPDTWSNELQLTGKLFNGRLDFVAGGFYFNQKSGLQPNGTYALNRLPGTNSVITNNKSQNRTWAGYAQGNFKFTDRLTFTGGLRYTEDYAYLENFLFNHATQQYVRTSGGKGQPAGEAKWNAISYTASLQYQLAPRSMIYLTNSKGYSTGGLQNVIGLEKFDPDTLNNFELGMKSTFRLGSDWQVRTELSGFYGFYNNVKVTTGFYTPIPNTNPPATQIVIATTNGATARNKGFEVDVQAAYSDLFTIRGFATYVKNYYTEFSGPVQQAPQLGIVDLTDSPFPNSPPWKFGINGTIHAPIDRDRFGDLSLTAQYTYTSQYWVTYGKPMKPYVPGDPDTAAVCKARRTAANGYGPLSADGKMVYKDCAPALDNLNLTLSWDNPMGHQGLSAQIAVTNVLKNKTPMGITSGYDTGLFNAAYPNFPRFVYVSLKHTF